MGRPILTVEEMQAAEAAVFATGVDSFAVMLRAGEAIAEFVHAHWSEGRIQILCGPGGNGGDGFVAAAILSKLWRKVDVFCEVDLSELKGDAARAAAFWAGPLKPLSEAYEAPHELVVDALYGAGLSRPLEGHAAALAARQSRVISVDVPSGLEGTSAKPLGPCFRAEATITFAALRPAHVLLPGASFCGAVITADIGVPVQTTIQENSPQLWLGHLPQPDLGGYKHQRGHLKVVSGGVMSTGAARLVARAGLRSGAGLVTLLSPPAAIAVNASHLTAVMLDTFSDARDLTQAVSKANVAVIGPGAGVTPATRANVETLLKTDARIVLDADALTVFEGQAEMLFSRLRTDDIMTPHTGEFRRLFGVLLETSVNKIEAVKFAAQRAGCVVLLKGADTLIAHPDGRAIINTHASRWLATAGSGDVLAGVIAGQMAQGVNTFTAAGIGAWVHGEAGRRIGAGLIAEDLDAQLPEIMTLLYNLQG